MKQQEQQQKTCSPAPATISSANSAASLTPTEPEQASPFAPTLALQHSKHFVKKDPIEQTPAKQTIKAELQSPLQSSETSGVYQDAQTPFHEGRARTTDFEEGKKTIEGQKDAPEPDEANKQPLED